MHGCNAWGSGTLFLFSSWINCPLAIQVQLWDTLPFSLPELNLLLLSRSLCGYWSAKLLLCLRLFLHVWVAQNVSLVAFVHLNLVCAVLHTWFSSQPQTSMGNSFSSCSRRRVQVRWFWFESSSEYSIGGVYLCVTTPAQLWSYATLLEALVVCCSLMVMYSVFGQNTFKK
jgi:hypothetical protein